jgi:hypothetical protein
MLIIVGGMVALAGVLIVLSQKSGFGSWLNWIGNLPLDFRIDKNNFRLFFPLGTSIVLSIILSLILFIINKFISR